MTHPSATLTPTQRRITLLRHAKAEPDTGRDDRLRALAISGQQDALKLGAWLHQQTMLPDAVLCSSAQRTRETFAALNAPIPVTFLDSLYLASAGEMVTLLQGVDDATRHILLIAHNPGIHALAAQLAGHYAREADADQLLARYPTCGLVSMAVPATHWAGLTPQSGLVDLVRFETTD